MLICFKSKAAADITMYKTHIQSVLDSLGKNIERGVITATENAQVIQKIEDLCTQDRKINRVLDELNDFDENDLDEFEKKQKREFVSLSARVFPLLEMLRAANKMHVDVIWGV
ncbi:MAG: DUF1840 domain-containing protein [Undibacterium sp.]|nr:DUF1840 domain-containing protein [Undibacterium sp.]